MTLKESILLSLAAGFLIIGIGQTIYGKFFESYWIFMLSAITLLAYRIIKQAPPNPPTNTSKNDKKRKK